MRMTPKQTRFCEEYLVDLNATQAAVRAGYSPRTANQIASQNLAKLKIQHTIMELRQQITERTQVTIDRVLKRLAEIAFNDSEAKHSDVLKACELLGKHLGMFTEKLQVTHEDEKPQVVVYLPDNGRG